MATPRLRRESEMRLDAATKDQLIDCVVAMAVRYVLGAAVAQVVEPVVH